jgi:PKD repeat protein
MTRSRSARVARWSIVALVTLLLGVGAVAALFVSPAHPPASSGGLGLDSACPSGGYYYGSNGVIAVYANTSRIVAPLAIELCAEAVANITVLSYSWALSTGSNLSGNPVQATYTSPGDYNASVTAQIGTSAYTTFDFALWVTLPVDLNVSPDAGTNSLTVTANATVSLCAGGCTVDFTADNALGPGWDQGPANLTTPPGGGTVLVSLNLSSPGFWDVHAAVIDGNNDRGWADVNITVNSTMPNLTIQWGHVALASNPLAAKFFANVSAGGVGTGPNTSVVLLYGDGSHDAGDGTENVSTVHTYGAPGTYQVEIMAGTSSGGFGSVVFPVVVTGSAPFSAGFNWTETSLNGTVQFFGFTSDGTAPYQFSWTFGDNSTGVGHYVSHTYATAGVYGVTLTVTDAINETAIDGGNVTVAIGNSSFSIQLGYTVPNPGYTLTVDFTANVTGGVAPLVVDWDFGDGSSSLNTSQTSIDHNYSANGTYTASVFVVDALGFSAAATVLVDLGTGSGGGGVVVQLSASPTTGPAPFNTTFTVSATGGGGVYNLSLATGIGQFSTNLWNGTNTSVPATYTVPGTYTVTATVADLLGVSGSASVTINVTGTAPLAAYPLQSATLGVAPLTVGFLVNVSGGNSPYAVAWTWGDGTISSSGSGQLVDHTYSTPGTYAPSVMITDAANRTLTLALSNVTVTATGNITNGTQIHAGGQGLSGSTLAYLGIGAGAAVVSGAGVGLVLRRVYGQRDARALVRALQQRPGGPKPPGV